MSNSITSSIAFDSTATFQPTISPSTVQLTGTATNPSDIANIEFYDGTTDLGGTGPFQGTRWIFNGNLKPGLHDFKAVATTISGQSYGVLSPYQLVTGIQNQPYVFQELDENSAGIVTRVSSYDGSGTLVSQTAVTTNGAAASPFSIAFDPSATYAGPTEAMLTGTYSSYGNAAEVEIFDGSAGSVVDPKTDALLTGAKSLGFATINPDGTWTFDAHVSAGTHEFTAVATSLGHQTAVAQSSFSLVTGVVGNPYVYEEIDHNANGSVAATASYAQDGSLVSRSNNGGSTVNGGSSSGEVLRSSYNDVMTGDGTGNTTFMFKRGFGQDEITNFNYLNTSQSPTGVEHDILSLPQATFRNLAQVIRHTTTALDGDAMIHLNPHDSIKLDGVTKADLITHPNTVRFHS